MNKVKLVFIPLICLFLTACIDENLYKATFQSLIPEQESAFAKNYLEKVRQQDFSYVREHLIEEVSVTEKQLQAMVAQFPQTEPDSIEIIGVNTFMQEPSKIWQARLSFEYQFQQQWVLANILVRHVNDQLKVVGLDIYPARNQSIQQANRFGLQNKSIFHYMMLFGAIMMPIFMLVSAYFCVRTPNLKRKWLWMIFVCLGFTSLSINWTTGAFFIKPLFVYVLGASATKTGLYAPWMVSISLPIGAIAFWYKRHHLITNKG